jgi:hypothetical protein
VYRPFFGYDVPCTYAPLVLDGAQEWNATYVSTVAMKLSPHFVDSGSPHPRQDYCVQLSSTIVPDRQNNMDGAPNCIASMSRVPHLPLEGARASVVFLYGEDKLTTCSALPRTVISYVLPRRLALRKAVQLSS